jgi:hypothetical protein
MPIPHDKLEKAGTVYGHDGGTAGVFVSYSSRDRDLVRPLVRLLRVFESDVFFDEDRIRGGKKWREVITEEAALEAKLLVVFWCFHSSESAEVRHEWQTAAGRDCDILPVLLDDTPLDSELAAYQWVDMRPLAAAAHERPMFFGAISHLDLEPEDLENLQRAGTELHAAIRQRLGLL